MVLQLFGAVACQAQFRNFARTGIVGKSGEKTPGGCGGEQAFSGNSLGVFNEHSVECFHGNISSFSCFLLFSQNSFFFRYFFLFYFSSFFSGSKFVKKGCKICLEKRPKSNDSGESIPVFEHKSLLKLLLFFFFFFFLPFSPFLVGAEQHHPTDTGEE